MKFIQKVEAASNKVVHKPKKQEKAKKLKTTKSKSSVFKPKPAQKAKKPDGAKKFEKAGAALGKKTNLNTSFQKLRAALPSFMLLLRDADPFNRPSPGNPGDVTWNNFFTEAAPEIVTLLLIDMGEITKEEAPAFRRLFKQRVKR